MQIINKAQCSLNCMVREQVFIYSSPNTSLRILVRATFRAGIVPRNSGSTDGPRTDLVGGSVLTNMINDTTRYKYVQVKRDRGSKEF